MIIFFMFGVDELVRVGGGCLCFLFISLKLCICIYKNICIRIFILLGKKNSMMFFIVVFISMKF